MNETIDSILTYWFGNKQSAAEISEDRKKLWWGKDDAMDQEVTERFREMVEAVADARLDHWRESAKGLLASIICTDQFPRNIYRGTPRSFGYDEFALNLAQQTVATGMDMELTPIQRVFAYLPFEHSEQLDMQDRSMFLFTRLKEQVATPDHDLFNGFLEFARRHRDIIERFGRFPHRNEILGRESTNEELEFLSQPGSSF